MKEFIETIKNWVRTDGLLHILSSFAIFVFLCLVCPMWLGVIVTIWVGAWKEFYDKANGGFAEWHDMICDSIGVVIGIVYITLALWIGLL